VIRRHFLPVLARFDGSLNNCRRQSSDVLALNRLRLRGPNTGVIGQAMNQMRMVALRRVLKSGVCPNRSAVKSELAVVCLSGLLLMGIVGCVGISPHSSPDSITDLEIREYKFGLEEGCTDQSLRRGEGPEAAKNQCGCALHVLEAGLTHQEWQAVTYAAQKRQENVEGRILGPYNVQFKACHQAT
jgi:hypothetical protein